jgi:large repetitive protein
MKKMVCRPLAALAFGVSIMTGLGCEFITAVDRDKIPQDTGSGGGGQGGGGGGGQGGSGGGAAGQGGSGGGQGGGDSDVLLISEVRSRGKTGAGDEFVELYNPTDAAVTADARWTLQARSAVGDCATLTPVDLWTGSGEVVPAHGHLLIAATGTEAYLGEVSPDATYPVADVELADAGSLVVLRGEDVVDALCYQYDAPTLAALTTCATSYTCEGTPALNPHNGDGSSNTDASLERKPGGTQGNGADTGDSAADFAPLETSTPQSLQSAPPP